MVDSENTPLLPLAVLDGEGRLLRVVLSSEKAYKKSLESGSLWAVNPETGRVLPLEDAGGVVELSRGPGFAVARVEGASGAPAATNTAATNTAGPERGGPAPGSPEAGALDPAAPHYAGVLAALEQVIVSRQAEMKEGSYTTYLFEKGVDKIRKKTGEEAIELLLTTEREDTVSEAADLIYHLLVLLRALDIPVAEVLGELEKRLMR